MTQPSDWVLNKLSTQSLILVPLSVPSATINECPVEPTLQNEVTHEVVFLLDVDNTLLDNDRFRADLDRHLEAQFGVSGREGYWADFDRIRAVEGCEDYLQAVQESRHRLGDESKLLSLAKFLLDYPFEQRLYPQALEVLAHLGKVGLTVVLSDGDVVFQPHKIRRAGIWAAVEGRVLIYEHRQHCLHSVQRHFPAKHYVLVDDEPRTLADIKDNLRDRVTTILVGENHSAETKTERCTRTEADLAFDGIGDLQTFQISDLKVSAG